MNISIIIPCYNQGQYLAQAIESVINQTIKVHELIIVVDGAKDNSLEIAKSYEHSATFPIKIINQINKGLSSARNTGIMNATGDYILPLDADDIMLENCVERMNTVIEESYADIVAPSFKEFGVRDTTIILMKNPTLKEFVQNNMIPYCSAIKRSVLLEVGGYSPRMIWGWEDYALWFDLLSRGKSLVTIPEVLLLYRTKEYSMINEANLHGDELWRQIHKDFPHIFNK